MFVASAGRREGKVILDMGAPESKEDSKVGETWKAKKCMVLSLLKGNGNSGRGKDAGSRDDEKLTK